jgi:hypothetical protein
MAMTKLSPSDVIGFQAIFKALDDWFKAEMRKLYGSAASPGTGVLMGFPVWGQKYFDRMQQYFVASILAEKNLEALRGRCRLVLFTTEDSDIPVYIAMRALKPLGIDLEVLTIPKTVMDEVPKNEMNKYWVLGTVQNLLIQMAGFTGMAFHMAQPDHVFEKEYWPNIFRLGEKHDAICQLGISATAEAAFADIELWRLPDGSLSVPGRELGDIGWRHLHKQMHPGMQNGKWAEPGLPSTFWTSWQGRDKLHLYSCHMNPAWLSPKLCALAQTRIPATVDSELPAFIPGDFYVPKVEDGLTFIEVSDDSKWSLPKAESFEHFSDQAWSTIKFDHAYLPYYQRVCEFPIHPQETWMEEAEIKAAHADLVKRLIADCPVNSAPYRFCRALDASPRK